MIISVIKVENPYTPIILPNSSLCCFIMIAASDHSDDWKWVDVTVLSNHLSFEYAKFRGFNGRLKRAWRALNGRLDPQFEFLSHDELEEFVEAVRRAGEEAFGNQPVTFAANTANTTLPFGNAETVSE